MQNLAKYALDSARDSAESVRDSAKLDKSEFDILVAKCGKTIGLKGEVKLIIYSDFLEVFTKGNVFLCKGAESSLDFAISQNLVKNNPRVSANLETRPLRGAKNRIQASSSARADFLLEAEKRGSPPKSEKRQLLARRGSGEGGAALLQEKISEISGEGFAESIKESQSGLPRSHSFARNDEFLDSSLRLRFAQNDNVGRDSSVALLHQNNKIKEIQNDKNGVRVAESSLDSAFFLTLKSFNPHKSSATFAEITNIDSAKNLTSMLLFSTKSLTQQQCVLGEGEHFWFEIINKSVVEKGEVLGVVGEIERIGSVDYLIIEVDDAIFAKYSHIKAKRFYLPYISRYILGAENGVVAVQDALLILENS